MKIVAFAYACEPQKGSEPEAGWGWSRLLAAMGDTWVITRANNREAIEAELPRTPEAASLHFVYVDLPEWAVSWKRGQRGIHLYYLLWQVAALRRARRLQAQERFDLVWHLTLANAWLGSLAALVGPPFVYGPIGGGIRPPWRLAPALGIRGSGYELLRAGGQVTGRYANPAARIAWRKARLILVQNRETKAWLPRRIRSKAVLFPNALLLRASEGTRKQTAPTQTALYAGRLLPLKGITLAIRAIAQTAEWRLVVVGGGSDEHRLRRLARRLNVHHRVEFTGWLAREELLDLMREGFDLLLFPSMHEEAGLVVLEALACGLPVVCLKHGGPPLLAGSGGVAVSSKGGSRPVVCRIATCLSDKKLPSEELVRVRSLQFSLDAVSGRLQSLLMREGLVPSAAHE